MWQRDLATVFGPGTVLAGKYCVERTVGAGGMGVVLAVRHKDLGEPFALKLLQPAAAASAAARERFAREAKAAAKLRSEHVARATDFGFLDDEGAPYMVLELLEGQNLAERLAAGGPVDPTMIASWMLQACDALREAHEHGIVHRELKPSNLFLATRPTGNPIVKVLDFGIAKTGAADASALTKTSTTMGSPFYMSPEQMRSAKTADQRSDIWSLGVTMYELSTGQVPFIGESVTEVAIAVIECAVASPTTHRADLPETFVSIVMRCLHKRPERRYQDIDELAADLASFAKLPWTPSARSGRERKVTLSPLASSGETDAFARTEAEGLLADSKGDATVPQAPALTLIGSSGSAPPPQDGVTKPSARDVVGSTPASENRRPARPFPIILGAAGILLSVLVTFFVTRSMTRETPNGAPAEQAALPLAAQPEQRPVAADELQRAEPQTTVEAQTTAAPAASAPLSASAPAVVAVATNTAVSRGAPKPPPRMPIDGEIVNKNRPAPIPKEKGGKAPISQEAGNLPDEPRAPAPK